MGTRGAIGWRKDGVDKIAYNHFDSYPTCLGVEMLEYARNSIPTLHTHYDREEMIDEEVPPTPEQIKRCKDKGAVDLKVSTQDERDWYCLLRETQGKLKETADLGYMIDYSKFLADSLFCEWAYIINLDSKKFEVYQGFQTNVPEGRYGKITQESVDHQLAAAYKGSHMYFGVGLIKEYSLAKLPSDSAFVKEMDELTGQEEE